MGDLIIYVHDGRWLWKYLLLVVAFFPSSSQMCQGDTQRMLEKLAVSSVQERVGLSLASQWENMLFVLCHSVSETVESLLNKNASDKVWLNINGSLSLH